MKSFVFSLIALLVLCIGVISNCIYIQSVCAEFDLYIEQAIENRNEESVEALISQWNEHKFSVSISVPHKETDELERILIVMQQRLTDENPIEFYEACAIAKNAVNEIKIHGTVKADNIF